MTTNVYLCVGVWLLEWEQFEHYKLSGMPFDRQSTAPTFLVEIVDSFFDVILVATILWYLFPIYNNHKSNDNDDDDKDKKVEWFIIKKW